MNNQLLNRIYPESWKIIPLAEFAQPTKNSFVDGPFGSDLKVSDYAESGVRVLQLQNLGDGQFINESKIYTTEEKASQIARCIAKPGDLIIAKMADPLARAALLPDVEEKYVIVADLIKLSAGDHVDPFYLTSFINFSDFRREAERRSTGTTRTRISLSTLKRIGVPNPPKYVQRKIARILQTIDQAIEHTSTLIEKYKQIKAGLMHDLFTRGIGADGKLRPSREQAPDLYQQAPIGWIPKEWKVLSIVQLLQQGVLLEVQDGNHGESHPKKSDFVPEGIPFIMASDISDGQIDAENCYRISEKQYKGLRIGFSKPGDVLLSHKATIGLVAVVTNDTPEIMLTPQVTYFRLSGLVLTSEYLAAFFKSHAFQIPLKSLAQQSTRDYIGITAQKRLHIAYPEQMEEQSKIAQGLHSIEKKLRKEKDCLQILRTEKAGLMHDLLTGKVQVTPDSEATHG